MKTGFGGYYGNKGGVIINFRLFGSRFGIVNTHLPANDGEIKARIADWKTIEAHRYAVINAAYVFHPKSLQNFSAVPTLTMFCREKISWEPRDYLFWIGDLNFRVAVDPSLGKPNMSIIISTILTGTYPINKQFTFLYWLELSCNSAGAEEINARVKKGLYKDVLEKDELNQVREQGLIFEGWNEAEIKFNPTFKVSETNNQVTALMRALISALMS